MPLCSTLSNKLSWSHNRRRLGNDSCVKACISEIWRVRNFNREEKTGLSLRLAPSKDYEAGAFQIAVIDIVLKRIRPSIIPGHRIQLTDGNLHVYCGLLFGIPDSSNRVSIS